MKKRTLLSLIPAIALGLMVSHATPVRAEGVAPAEAQKLLLKMIEAVKSESYDAFLVDADANVKKQLSRQQFEGICGLYSKPLKKGYTMEYFGQLKKRDMVVYVWKISATGAQEEVLVRLAVKDGKVAGIMVQ